MHRGGGRLCDGVLDRDKPAEWGHYMHDSRL